MTPKENGAETWADCRVRSEEFAWLRQARKEREDRQARKRELDTPDKAKNCTQETEDDRDQGQKGGQKCEPGEGSELNPKIGLALSGGGIRSATFNLGVLQALAECSILEKVGFVSSVSGGSYINSWLAHWIHRDGFDNVRLALADHSQFISHAADPCLAACSRLDVKQEQNSTGTPSGPPEKSDEGRYQAQKPVSHLRNYSSYLTPQRGWFSTDTWSAVAAYCLRLLPNMLFVVLLASTALTIPRIGYDIYSWVAGPIAEAAKLEYESQELHEIRAGIDSLQLQQVPFSKRHSAVIRLIKSITATSPGSEISRDALAEYLRELASINPSWGMPPGAVDSLEGKNRGGDLSGKQRPDTKNRHALNDDVDALRRAFDGDANLDNHRRSSTEEFLDRDEVFERVRIAALRVELALSSLTATENHITASRDAASTSNDRGELPELQRSIDAFLRYNADPAPHDPALAATLLQLSTQARTINDVYDPQDSTLERRSPNFGEPRVPISPATWSRFDAALEGFLAHQGSYEGEDAETRRMFLGLRQKLALFSNRWDGEQSADDLDLDDAIAVSDVLDCCEESLYENTGKHNQLSKAQTDRATVRDLDKALIERIPTLISGRVVDPRNLDCLRQIASHIAKLDNLERFEAPEKQARCVICVAISTWVQSIFTSWGNFSIFFFSVRLWLMLGLALAALLVWWLGRDDDKAGLNDQSRGSNYSHSEGKPVRWLMGLMQSVKETLKESGFRPASSIASDRTAIWRARATFAAMFFTGSLLAADGILHAALSATTNSRSIWPWLGRKAGPFPPQLTIGLYVVALLCAVFFSLSMDIFGAITRARKYGLRLRRWPFLLCAALVGGSLFQFVAWLFHLCFVFYDRLETGYILATAFGPLATLLAYIGMASVGVLLLPFYTASQEWLNRIWGLSARFCFLWSTIVLFSLAWPRAEMMLLSRLHVQGGRTFGVFVGWLLASAGSIWSAFDPKSSGPMPVALSPIPWRVRFKTADRQNDLMNVAARVAPYLFTIGLLMTLAVLINQSFGDMSFWKDICLAFLLGFATMLVGCKLDVNRLSLHSFYRYRLIECFLNASPVPHFIDKSQTQIKGSGVEPILFRMSNLSPCPLRAKLYTEDARFYGYDGPYPLINCTLNITRSDRLSLQARRAKNFIFSPLACGYTSYPKQETQAPQDNSQADTLWDAAMLPTQKCASVGDLMLSLDRYPFGAQVPSQPEQSITLGAAMTISGAALSPNEGSHTSPAVAALLTLFNIRLGWWLGNPRHSKTYCKESPTNGFVCIWKELLARATDDEEYVYLSDGGHFENLGIYELVRRRCKLIIVGDADSDPHYDFDDLINAIQLCQADFGVTIRIDTDALQNSGPSNWSRSAFTVGTIDYGGGCCNGSTHGANERPRTSEDDGAKQLEESLGCECGYLIYLKSAVTRENSVPVLNYDRDSKDFPHEPTANQWFDQAQFEAYRTLGLETAKSAVEKLHLDHRAERRTVGQPVEPVPAPGWWNQRIVKCDWDRISRGIRKILQVSD